MKWVILYISLVLIFCTQSFASTGKVLARPDAQKSEHVIIFGDSLSDTGNYPEPSNVLFPTLGNFNLYVPITNPVPSNLYGKAGVPSLHFLKQSIPQQGTINQTKKVLYSINWSLYLLYHLDPGHPLIPWSQHYVSPTTPANNINYAWASAVADGGRGIRACFHDNGSAFPGKCDAKTLLAGKQRYLKHTQESPDYDRRHHYVYADLDLPNFDEQVALYLNDKSVSVKNNTSFFIYIGSNDVSHYVKSKIIEFVLLPFSFVKRELDKKMLAVASSVDVGVKQIEKAYRGKHYHYKIYVLTLPKLSNLHEAYKYTHAPLVGGKLKKVLDYAVASYNNALARLLKGDPHVVVADTGHKIDELANEDKYKNAVDKGLACIDDPSEDYTNPSLRVNANCNYNNAMGQGTYLSWNNGHFTSQVNEQVAEFLLKVMGLEK